METSKNNIGGIIRKHRELKDISQDALGDIIGKSQQTIYRYENNITVPPKNVWNFICKTLDIPLGAYFHEAISNAEYVNETKNQTYNDKPFKELNDLIIKERKFVNEMRLTKLLKTIPKMSEEKRKLFIQISKTFLN